MWISDCSDTQNTQRHGQFILVWASEPYVWQYSVLRVRNAQSGVSYNNGVEREIGRGVRDAILGFLGSVPISS